MADELAHTLAAVVAAEPAIDVAYLFGSRASGQPRLNSDVDLAVAYARQLDGAAREAARRRLVVALADALGSLGETADIVDLERSGTTVAFRAIHDGRLLIARHAQRRVELEARIARRYDDEAPYRKLFRQAARRAGQAMDEATRGR